MSIPQRRPTNARPPTAVKPASAALKSRPAATTSRPSIGKSAAGGQPGASEEAAVSSKHTKGVDDSLSYANQPLVAAPSLAAFTNLHRLDLTNTGLKSVGFVKAVKNTLTWLSVSGNDLSGEGAWQGIEELTRLFVLNASNCSLTAVPVVVESLYSLKALVLSNNQLTSLEHVAKLPDLNTIVISNNALTSLPASLNTLPALKKISAAHNKFTADQLPDLTTLIQLREVKMNDNPTLTALPSHLATWGKGTLGNFAEFKGRRPAGLEILDFGNCGFEDWLDLQPLVGQGNIVNLVLKGTKVAEEAKEAGGFDEYKRKLLILLPALRILDGQRFDAKFFDLKEKRLSRPELEQPQPSTSKLTPVQVAAGQATSSNNKKGLQRTDAAETRAKLEAQVLAVEKSIKELKTAEKLKAAGMSSAAPVQGQEEGEQKKKKKKERTVDQVEAEQVTGVVQVVVEDKPVVPKKAKSKKRAVEVEGELATEGQEAPKKKRKNRHEPRRTEEGTEVARHETLAVTPTAITAPPPPPPAVAVAKLAKSKKRKAPVEASATTPAIVATSESVEKRKKKAKGGVLSALRGDDVEQAEEIKQREAVKPAPLPFVAPEGDGVPAGERPEKVKSSVVGVVVVKKKDKRERDKLEKVVALDSLLAAPAATTLLGWN